tara:strand:- start:83 stop:718 length:636 start_codon:yes stop_codon:yes gene_type:complete
MKKVLFITANPKSEDQSFSLQASRRFIEKYKNNNPSHEVIELDLYNESIPFIDEDVFSGWNKLGRGDDFSSLTKEEREKVQTINGFTDQFINADKYIFATPMWNFSMPPKMKVYIDTLMIAGRTFEYTENGPQGLLNGKKALHVHASGGVYSEGPAQTMDFGNKYLETVLSFMGVTDYQAVLLEGTNMPNIPDEDIKSNALEELSGLAEVF